MSDKKAKNNKVLSFQTFLISYILYAIDHNSHIVSKFGYFTLFSFPRKAYFQSIFHAAWLKCKNLSSLPGKSLKPEYEETDIPVGTTLLKKFVKVLTE